MNQSKCGNVFRDADGNFNYTCTCCEFEFMSAIDFEEHVNAHFIELCDVDAEMELENELETDIKTESVEVYTLAYMPKLNETDAEMTDGGTATFDEADDVEDADDEEQDDVDDDIVSMQEYVLVDDASKAKNVEEIIDELGDDRNLFTCQCCNDVQYNCVGLKQQHIHKYADLTKCCLECPAYYEKESELNAHKKLHNLANPMICPFCNEIFLSVHKMKRHLHSSPSAAWANANRKLSPKKKIVKSNEHMSTQNADAAEKDGKREKFVCDICQKEYAYLHYLKEHLKRHSDNTLLHACQVCGHKFKLRQNLTAHMRTHTGEKPYQCKLCGKAFNQPYYMTIHMRIHAKDKPYKCELCGVSFVTSSHLGRHMKSHNNIKPHKCELCDRAFILPGHLQDHMRSQHTGERPFDCQVCGNKFARRKLLRQHMQLHGEKKFKCKFCPLVFAQSAGRRGHEIRVHNAT